MRTIFAKKEDALKGRAWRIVDADGISLGRLASEVAALIRGKTRADFAPHSDGGDFVIVINAQKVKLTGSKLDTKIYYTHSGYPGGLKPVGLRRMLDEHPERVVEKAVYGMLPKTRLGKHQRRKLKVYAGSDHPHAAQQPQVHTFTFLSGAEG